MDSALARSDNQRVRIVAGEFRGRSLAAPPGDATRPSADRVREALYSILYSVEDARVLDLYAGTGALALEALSRGARHATLVERGRPALASIARNVEALRLGPDRCEVRAEDVEVALRRLIAAGRTFDLVLADPPYEAAARALPGVLTAAATLLAPDGRAVMEHPSGEPSPPAPPGLERTDVRTYGAATLAFYARATDP